MIRLFAALAIPGDIGQEIAGHRQGLPGALWRPLEALHVTLRFAGDVPENQGDDLDAELSTIAGAPLNLSLGGVGVFGDGADMRALWAGVEGGEALIRLAGRCETAARRAGLRAETRRWRPHVTLAYLRQVDPGAVAAWVQDHNLLKSRAFQVAVFGLYSSWRGDDGAVYRLERTYRLG